MDLYDSMKVAASGLNAQSARLQVISENLANADSVATTPGGEPYRRKVISFHSVLDHTSNLQTVQAGQVATVRGALTRRFDPNNPAAGPDGYIQLPNVNPLIELMDMREAQQTYQANLNVVSAAKTMVSQTIALLQA